VHTDELIGAVLDSRYRIERKLGEGGMGMVYQGEHVRTGRKCAVKLLPPEASHDPEAVKRFEREARVLGALGHPGIVGVHDFSETSDGRPFFVMDNLEGEDLAQRLGRVGRLDWEDAKKIVDEIAAALWAAHQAGVLHRDLKPGNVFLAQSPAAPERVVLLDFGLAKGGITNAMTLTQSNMVMGTPLYMSPEQARSVGVDARSDIYSLAALTYELVAGRPPFVGPNYTAVLASLLTEPPPKVSVRAAPGVIVPGHLDEVLDIALSKDPADRQPDVASFATAVLQRRPAWADTTARRIESGQTPGAGLGVATGPPSSAVGTESVADSASLQLAATVASSPPVAAPPDPSTAATLASDPLLPRASTPTVSQSADFASSPRQTVDPGSTPVGTRSPRRRRPVMVLVVVGLVVLGAVGAALAYWAGRRGTESAPGASTAKATGPLATDATVRADAGVPEATAPDAMEASGAPDGGTTGAAEMPIDRLVNRKLRQLKEALNALPKKGEEETRKVVRRLVRSATPPARRAGVPPGRVAAPRRRAAGVPQPPGFPTPRRIPPKYRDILRLSKLMSKRDYKGCLRAVARMSPTADVHRMGVACALSMHNWSLAGRMCVKFIKRYPSDQYAKSCRRVLKSNERRKVLLQRRKERQERRRLRERQRQQRR